MSMDRPHSEFQTSGPKLVGKVRPLKNDKACQRVVGIRRADAESADLITHSTEDVLCQVQEASSVTRLGNFLDFGQLFKALSNNESQISHILRHFL